MPDSATPQALVTDLLDVLLELAPRCEVDIVRQRRETVLRRNATDRSAGAAPGATNVRDHLGA